MCGAPKDKCALKQQTQTMLTKRASAHWPQCQLPLASDPSQRWHVGNKARKSQQGCGAWGLQHSRKTPLARGTEDEAGHPLQGRKFKGKVPLRSSAKHDFLCSNSSEEPERTSTLGPCAQDGEGAGEHLVLWTQSSHPPSLTSVSAISQMGGTAVNMKCANCKGLGMQEAPPLA